MSFRDIRRKLDDERGWSLGEDTVKKEYAKARARIWGTHLSDTPVQNDDNTGHEKHAARMEGGESTAELHDEVAKGGEDTQQEATAEKDAEGDVEEASDASSRPYISTEESPAEMA
jgi:hypothetical protein